MQAKVAAMLAELPPEELLALVPGARATAPPSPSRTALLTELKTRTRHAQKTPPME